MRSVLRASLVLAAVAVATCPAHAEDYFLTIGGGYSPTGNQVSLEKNVQLFRKLLSEEYPQGVSHDVYFSDGDSPARDLVFETPMEGAPRANLLLARIFQQSRYFNQHYRSHEIDNVQGGSNRKNIQQWFETTGSKLKAGDRLVLYVTAHGGRSGDKKNPMNTTLYLWNSERIQVKELADWMDNVDPEVPIVTVMVQCFSGGFSNVLFNHGANKDGVSAANRCGFFATVHDRVAAGCTPDIDEENYREYSTYFWEAIRGTTRTGKPIEKPDYNEDGTISFEEAHAYALLTSPTIDISIKTSGTFLREFSKTSWKADKKSKDKKPAAKTAPAKPQTEKPTTEADAAPPAESPEPAPEQQRPALLTSDSPFEQLSAAAPLVDRVVLVGLSKQLELADEKRASAARKLATKIDGEKKKLDREKRKKTGELKQVGSAIAKAVRNQWPELSNRWNPGVDDILSEHSDELIKFIEKHAKFGSFQKLRKEVGTLDEKKFELDRKWVKTQRLLRVLESAALAANLPHVASPELVQRYAQLRAVEAGALGSAGRSPQTVTAADSAGE